LREAHLDSSGLEVGVGERDGGKLGGTDGSLDISDILQVRGIDTYVVIGVGEDDGPRVSDPFVELELVAVH